MQSVHGLQIFREWPAPKAPGDRLLDHLGLIHVIEGGGHGLARGVVIDAHRLNLPHHARPTMPSHDQIVARSRTRRAGIVERACGQKIGKGLIDDGVRESFAM